MTSPSQPQPQRVSSGITSLDDRSAYNMVKKLFSKTQEEQEANKNRYPLPLPGKKRATLFREVIRWMLNMLPDNNLLGSGYMLVDHGVPRPSPSDCKDKRTIYQQLQLVLQDKGPEDYALQIEYSTITTQASRMQFRYLPLLRITSHAAQRLFKRLHTTDHLLVLREIQSLNRYYALLYILMHHARPGVTWLLPSPNGMFLIKRDDDGAPRMIAATWISDQKIWSNLAWQRAVQAARLAGPDTILLKDSPVYPTLSLLQLCQPGDDPATVPQRIQAALQQQYPRGRTCPVAIDPQPLPYLPSPHAVIEPPLAQALALSNGVPRYPAAVSQAMRHVWRTTAAQQLDGAQPPQRRLLRPAPAAPGHQA